MRIYMREMPGGYWFPCEDGDEGAVAFDKASSKETAEGRARRLVDALNASLTLVPGKRIASHGTRLELRDAAGQYHDAGLDHVAEFSSVFEAHVSDKPEVPSWENTSGVDIEDYWREAQRLGEQLKNMAQRAQDRGDGPGAVALIRLQLIQEELAELAVAILERDIVECLDALCDLSYVVDGTYLAFGLGHYKLPGLAEVHRSNMSKAGPDGRPITSSAGRIVKGPNYSPPDLKAVLGTDSWEEDESQPPAAQPGKDSANV